jgi:hypothetical protein
MAVQCRWHRRLSGEHGLRPQMQPRGVAQPAAALVSDCRALRKPRARVAKQAIREMST